MKDALSLMILLPLFAPTCSFSQEYSYTHYDISDGLAGSTVYCITQDKDGFIWTGTETGVSRFDGTHFQNYTTIDGLPDVEVLEMFGDSKGRVWMAPFRRSICYYYKGKIHNQENDPLLHSFKLCNNVDHFAEDCDGNILVEERTALHLLKADGTVQVYDSIGGRPIRNCAAIATSRDGHFLIHAGPQVLTFSGKGFVPLYTITIESCLPNYISMNAAGVIWRVDSNHAAIHSFVSNKTVSLPFERAGYRHNSFNNLDDSLFYYNEFSGALEYNLHTGQTRRFLPGKQVSRTFRDATGNTWFTTLGQGIYRLNSDEFRTIRLNTPEMEVSSIYAIKRVGNRLLVGDNHNYLFDFHLPDLHLQRCVTTTRASKNRLLDFGMLTNGTIYVASDESIEEVSSDLQRVCVALPGLKSCFRVDEDKLLVSSFWGAGIFDLHSFRLTDTLWHERSTTIFYHLDTIFIGTLTGLYAVAPDKSVHFLGENIPFFRKRISALAKSADGTLWVASYDAGVIGYRNGAVTTNFSKHQGLTSDICRTLLVHDNALWVGTDKGLNRIGLGHQQYPVAQYTSQDGLGSDIVNSIYGDGPFIYVGTPAGLSFFDETKINSSESCRLHLLSVLNLGKERIGDTVALLLPYTDKYIRFEFAGISYRSVGGITYQYRLLGLDSAWRTTKEAFLEYPTLPSGSYELQLEAFNKFGLKSNRVLLRFTVTTPWWQSVWFYGFVFALFLFLTWLFVSLRIRQIRNRQKEKEKINQRMTEMEHMALQAQMNPHFIFNCLNSIQQYIFDQDIFMANKYIAGFARLIRATLQNSSRPFVPLGDEIDYLSGYLSLEKLRFKEKMEYTIEVDLELDKSLYVIPPMLIQPYVENSMRHGLRHKLEGKGYIHIKFLKTGDRMTVTIEDNGIGREKAASFKTREHIEYQSKGMSLTGDRIRMLNAKYGNSIRVTVSDLKDAAGKPSGTRVVLEFPLLYEP